VVKMFVEMVDVQKKMTHFLLRTDLSSRCPSFGLFVKTEADQKKMTHFLPHLIVCYPSIDRNVFESFPLTVDHPSMSSIVFYYPSNDQILFEDFFQKIYSVRNLGLVPVTDEKQPHFLNLTCSFVGQILCFDPYFFVGRNFDAQYFAAESPVESSPLCPCFAPCFAVGQSLVDAPYFVAGGNLALIFRFCLNSALYFVAGRSHVDDPYFVAGHSLVEEKYSSYFHFAPCFVADHHSAVAHYLVLCLIADRILVEVETPVEKDPIFVAPCSSTVVLGCRLSTFVLARYPSLFRVLAPI